jgi:hypothetical protein
MHRTDDLQVGVFFDFAQDALGDVVVNARARDAADIRQIAPIRQALRHLANLLGAVGFGEIDRDFCRTRLCDKPVECDDDDACVTRLFHGSVEGIRR